jgi:hypothetical protein
MGQTFLSDLNEKVLTEFEATSKTVSGNEPGVQCRLMRTKQRKKNLVSEFLQKRCAVQAELFSWMVRRVVFFLTAAFHLWRLS